MAKYLLSTESIDFQSDIFFKALTNHFKNLMKLDNKERKELGVSLELSEEIKSFTGLNVDVLLSDFPPCVKVPDLSRNNVLTNTNRRPYMHDTDISRAILEAGGSVKGTVSLKEAKVTGVFTKPRSTIYLPYKSFDKDVFTAEEWAAITLHEIGHIFSSFEYITRTVTTNQVMATVARGLSTAKNPKEVEIILVNAKQALKLGGLDVSSLSKVTDQKIIELTLVSNYREKTKNELGTDIYNCNSFEQLADQFAARCGASRHLVTALDKLYKSSFHSSTRSTGMFVFVESVKVTLAIGSTATSAFANTIPVLGGLVADLTASFLWSMFLAMFSMDLNTTDYDRPGGRIKRIKEQLIEAIKADETPKELREAYKEDLEFVRSIEKQYNDRRQLFTVMGSWFLSDVRNRYEQERLSQELESLASNDLFTVLNNHRK